MNFKLKICDVCGCPQVSSLWHSTDMHYKNCLIVKNRVLGRKRIVSSEELRRRLEKFIHNREQDVDYAKELLLKARDCIKNTCLDEVYECRWDGRIVPEGVRLMRVFN